VISYTGYPTHDNDFSISYGEGYFLGIMGSSPMS
jgi:hypothetical protein